MNLKEKQGWQRLYPSLQSVHSLIKLVMCPPLHSPLRGRSKPLSEEYNTIKNLYNSLFTVPPI